ncbi:hypothetical protein [Alteromonas flava]|uniref:hypothetical protein n=1 Tax=Alteromonas flava TaxID=2048003 RepID=UPI000F5E010B|nr:hypothetical protein [Alteromonas flava]
MESSEKLADIIRDHTREWLTSLDAWAEQSNILLPILLSLVAAMFFWLVFSYLPERKRRKKLRPIVELALFDAYKKLFSLFDLVMRHSTHSPSFFQSKIRAGNLSEDDILLGLQNKCLNESYLYDPRVKDALLVVGEDIQDLTLDIDELANKVLSFHTYATAEELILLEKVREKIHVYHFGKRDLERHCRTKVNGRVIRPVDPSISYRHRNFFELYELFCHLQKLVLNYSPLDRERFVYKMQWLYYSGQYHLCVKLIRSQGSLFKKDSTLYRNYLALSERGRGRMKAFYKIIEDTYKSRPYGGSLVSSRSTFTELLEDNKLLEILAQFHSSEEISVLRASIKQESKNKEAFENANQELAKYFREQAIRAGEA